MPWDAFSSYSTKDAANSSLRARLPDARQQAQVGAPVFASTQMFGDGGTRPISRPPRSKSSDTIDETAFAMASPCAGVSRHQSEVQQDQAVVGLYSMFP